MNLDISQWLDDLTMRLRKAFGDRILYIGHAGSYARGEAAESSDIDVNIVLDKLSIKDLQKYREIIRCMPYSEKACGFVCGKKEITAWPAHDLFQFIQGCKILYGSLDGIIKVPADSDIRDNIRNTVSAIYHEVCHRYIFCGSIAEEAENLKSAYKTTYFVLQEWMYLKTRMYIPAKKKLLPELDGEDSAVLEVYINWESLKNDRDKRPDYYFSLLKSWCSLMLRRVKTAANIPGKSVLQSTTSVQG